MNASLSAARRWTMIGAVVAVALAAMAVTAPAADADPLPPGWRPPASNLQLSVSNLRVTDLGGTTARVSFETPRETVPCFRIIVAPSTRPSPTGGANSIDGIGEVKASDESGCDTETKRYRSSHYKVYTRLTSNTTYLARVSATTADGARYTGEVRFTTHKKRVRVTLTEIRILEDGDWFGKGEMRWDFGLMWDGGRVTACYPLNCDESMSSHGDRTIRPRTGAGRPLAFVLAEENFGALPRSLRFVARGFESDTFLTPQPDLGDLLDCFTPPCEFDPSGPAYWAWTVPQAVENSHDEKTAHVRSYQTGFESEMRVSFSVFHDDQTYPPNYARYPRVHLPWR